MQERRAYIRVPVDLKTTYEVRERVYTPMGGQAMDLSLGGMRVEQDAPVPTGSEVTVRFTLPQGEVHFKGLVAWCGESKGIPGKYQAGLRWVDLNPVSQARLNAFLITQTKAPLTNPKVLAAQKKREPVVWGRVVAASLAIGVLLIFLGAFYLELSSVYDLVQAQQRAISAYQQMIAELAGRPAF